MPKRTGKNASSAGGAGRTARFPDDGDTLIDEGRDVQTGVSVMFVVPPEQRLRLLAAAHRVVASLWRGPY
jgi:hypothetical protein